MKIKEQKLEDIYFTLNSKQLSFMFKHMKRLFLINSTKHRFLSSRHLYDIKLKSFSQYDISGIDSAKKIF